MKHLHQNHEFRFNEILFEHRNKEYGAYVLRNESDRILTKALFVGVSLLAAISITPLAISVFKSEVPPKDPEGVEIELVDTIIPDVPVPPIKIEPVKPVSPPNVKTYDAREVEPSRNAVESDRKEIPDDAVAGVQNNFKGEPVKDTYVQTPPVIGHGSIAPPVQPPVIEKIDKNKILNADDLGKEADFMGGINSFRNKVMNNFDGSGFDSGDVMKTTITFIVEIDGTISGIKANGADADFNSEAIRTIKAISKNGKWIPGKNKQGEAVRSYFQFPISMKFDN